MLSVSCACGTNCVHSTSGKSSSQVHSPAMKWLLYVRMARSAALTRWLCGSTSCTPMSASSFKYFTIAFDAMLSKMLNLGLNPLFLRYSIFSLNTSIIVSSFVFAIGSTRIEFELQSYIFNGMWNQELALDIYCSLL